MKQNVEFCRDTQELLYLCKAKKERDGYATSVLKLKSGIEPDLSLPRKRRSGLSPSCLLNNG